MRIHSLEHETFEDLANIKDWANTYGHTTSKTCLFNNDKLPSLDSFDWLVILGGSMNIYEEDKFPWLQEEKKFIKKAIEANKTIIGICLGGQLLSDILGGKVTRNEYKEIGWYPVQFREEKSSTLLFDGFPNEITAFHWHGDTFSIPTNSLHIAESEGCKHQAFIYNSRVIGLQFHLEYSELSIEKMLKHCANERQEGKYVQDLDIVREKMSEIPHLKELLFKFLNNIVNQGY